MRHVWYGLEGLPRARATLSRGERGDETCLVCVIYEAASTERELDYRGHMLCHRRPRGVSEDTVGEWEGVAPTSVG